MTMKTGLMLVAVIAAVGFCVCFFGGVGIDSTSKTRDAGIEKKVSDVVARTDAAAADAALALEQVNTATAAGAAGKEGKNGTACWDVDPDGECDLETEDVNGDGDCDVLDCRGDVGPKGDRGKTGFALVTIGGGKDGKDCTTGGTCEFYSVCCTDGKPTVTAEPTKPTATANKDKAKKQKRSRPCPEDTAKTMNYNYNYNYNEGAGKRPAVKVGNIRNEGTLNLNVN